MAGVITQTGSTERGLPLARSCGPFYTDSANQTQSPKGEDQGTKHAGVTGYEVTDLNCSFLVETITSCLAASLRHSESSPWRQDSVHTAQPRRGKGKGSLLLVTGLFHDMSSCFYFSLSKDISSYAGANCGKQQPSSQEALETPGAPVLLLVLL
ncbi:hypothetical protein TREES_T100004032 [Tupaia chinensis]|uniref:Uncharacterized protein n=1 Tax=Tupaia chinensis TaxID=246437 RepID=L9KNR7_TUPCH|nr:hypothetical protein TREES_T100004032 [Tupaia chinensis]